MKLIYTKTNKLKTDFYLNFKNEICIYVDNDLIETINRENLYSFDDKGKLIEFDFSDASFFSEINKDYIYLICKYILFGLSSIEEIFDFSNYLGVNFDKKYLQKINDEHSFTDNFRICIESEDFNDIYNFRKFKGCCGFYDDKIKIKNKTLLFGFNFGH